MPDKKDSFKEQIRKAIASHQELKQDVLENDYFSPFDKGEKEKEIYIKVIDMTIKMLKEMESEL